MGNGSSLEKPVRAKDSHEGKPSGCQHLAWSSSCMQGWRVNMEDAHICLPELSKPWHNVAMYGVLDGHGGEQVAKFCGIHLPQELHTRLGDACPWALGQSKAKPPSESVLRDALTDSFHAMDELLRRKEYAAELQSLTNPPSDAARPRIASVDVNMVGCTCCICCITEEFMLCANAGDSRAVLCRGGRAIPLSEDHKPNDPGERKRIHAAGGYLESQAVATGTMYRVNGNLNLSRALGDLEYKKDKSLGPEAQIISGTPDFICEKRCAEDEFIVICCDGVWDVKSNQQVVDFVRARLPDESDAHSDEAPSFILEDLLDACLSPNLRTTQGLGGDNMTAVVIRFPRSSAEPSAAIRAAEAIPSATLLKSTHRRSATSGSSLVVHLALSTSSSFMLKDISVGFSERTRSLELGLTGRSALMKFDLAACLPEGAESFSKDLEPSAKFFRKTNTLRVAIPLQAART